MSGQLVRMRTNGKSLPNRPDVGFFGLTQGTSATRHGMVRQGPFSVLDTAHAEARARHQQDQLDRVVQTAPAINGVLCGPNTLVNIGGKMRRTNGAGMISFMDENIIVAARQQVEEQDAFLQEYANAWTYSDQIAMRLLSVDATAYKDLTRKYDKGTKPTLSTIASHTFPPGAEIPDHLLDVDCSASAMRYLHGESLRKAAMRVRYILENASLPVVDFSGMSAETAAHRRDEDVTRPGQGMDNGKPAEWMILDESDAAATERREAERKAAAKS